MQVLLMCKYMTYGWIAMLLNENHVMNFVLFELAKKSFFSLRKLVMCFQKMVSNCTTCLNASVLLPPPVR